MGRAARFGIAILGVLVVGSWWVSRPITIGSDALPKLVPDPVAGERIFWAGGCASCHATPVDGQRAKDDAKLLLGGGLELDTPYGVFRIPNISPDPDDGIGSWSMLEFVNAMQYGVSPDGRHYYPAFPYTSYARMPIEDVMHLRAYLDSLPAVKGRIDSHSLSFPWSVRRGIGVWKRRYLSPDPVLRIDESNEEIVRGRTLVEGAGHCGECHSPRDRFGGLIADRWLAGAPSLEGDGRIPNLTPAGKNVSSWSVRDIAYYLESGFTPDFDTVGSSMVPVQESMAHLSNADRLAIAAYLKGLPAVESP